MERLFIQFKESVMKLFENFLTISLNLNTILKSCNKNHILKEKCNDNLTIKMTGISGDLLNHLEKISRRKMKCVFFGQTSNGKSAMINAILGSKVLPSSDGRTTSCFITIDSCDEEPYFICNGRRENDVSKLSDMANEICDNYLKIETRIELFWPSYECKLLDENVQLLDSPGVDYSTNNDKWIEDYCLDSDIFVYVVNSQATINESERKFFRKVTSFIKNPNIFVVMNKWDLCDTKDNENIIYKIRDQHLETVKDFLLNDLMLKCDAREKTFFLSAKEQLDNSGKKSVFDGKVTKRMEEFDKFFKIMCEEMSRKAVINKFGPHLDKAQDYLKDINEALNQFQNIMKSDFKKKNKEVGDIKKEINYQISKNFDKIIEEGKEKIKKKALPLANALSSKDQIEHSFSSFIHESIIHSLNDIFVKNIAELRIQMKKVFSSCSEFQLSDEVLSGYIPSSFKHHATGLEKDLATNIKKGDEEVQDCFIAKETELNNQPKGYVSAFGDAVGMAVVPLMFKFPVGAAVAYLASGIIRLYGDNSAIAMKNEMREQVRQNAEDILIKFMISSYRDCQCEIEAEVSKCVKAFCDDLREARDIIANINRLKLICETISEDLDLERIKIMSIDA